MEKMIRSFSSMFVMFTETAELAMRSLNNLMGGAEVRTGVVKANSINLAVTAQLDGEYALAERFQEIKSDRADITDEMLEQAREYRQNFLDSLKTKTHIPVPPVVEVPVVKTGKDSK